MEGPGGTVQTRPVNAFVLALLGSLFVLLGSILSLTLLQNSPSLAPALTLAFTTASGFLGVVMLFSSIMMYTRPDLHVAWGVAVLVVSVGSITSALGGFAGLGLGIIGTVLGIVGGSLGITWNPAGHTPTNPFRMCLSCGRPYHILFAFCPYCGAAAPAPAPATAWTPPRPPTMP
jgi:Family of unknown function (DUF6114)